MEFQPELSVPYFTNIGGISEATVPSHHLIFFGLPCDFNEILNLHGFCVFIVCTQLENKGLYKHGENLI